MCRRLRVAAPVFAPDGKPFGIVVVNVDMRPAFDRIRSSVRPGEHIYVVDEQGNYLVHPDRALEFGWELGTAANWRDDFPAFAPLAGASDGAAQIVPDQAGQSGGAALAPAIMAGKRWVGIIETAPNAVFMAPAGDHQEHLPCRRPDRGAVRRRFGGAPRAVADPADQSIDRGRRGHRAQRSGSSSRSTPAARRACSLARSRA